jgi:hypothetical protein
MGHPFLFVYAYQIKLHVHALQSCLLFLYALPKSIKVNRKDFESELPPQLERGAILHWR